MIKIFLEINKNLDVSIIWGKKQSNQKRKANF